MTNKKGIYDYVLISNEQSLLSALLITEKNVKLMNAIKDSVLSVGSIF